MKIAVDIRCLMSKNYSGVARYAQNLLKNILEIDGANQYKLFYNSKNDVSANIPKFNKANVRIFGFKYSNKILNFALKFFKYPHIDEIVGGADIFFMPNPNFAAFSKKCKKIITIHDLSFEIYPDFFSGKRRLWHKIINAKKLTKTCDKIIADSENTRRDLINLYGIAPEKIKVIGLGIDQQIYEKIANKERLKEIKVKFNLPDSFLLFLGTIEPRKNIEGIIETFNLAKQKYQELKNLNLIIAGETGWKNKKVFKLAKKSNFKNQIKFLGYISNQEAAGLYNLAQAFIFPSFYEGFGLPALEAQACGVPVITSANSSLAETLRDSAYLIKPDNLTEMASAIYDTATNQNLRKNLIEKGFVNAKKYDWQNCARETLDYITK